MIFLLERSPNSTFGKGLNEVRAKISTFGKGLNEVRARITTFRKGLNGIKIQTLKYGNYIIIKN